MLAPLQFVLLIISFKAPVTIFTSSDVKGTEKTCYLCWQSHHLFCQKSLPTPPLPPAPVTIFITYSTKRTGKTNYLVLAPLPLDLSKMSTNTLGTIFITYTTKSTDKTNYLVLACLPLDLTIMSTKTLVLSSLPKLPKALTRLTTCLDALTTCSDNYVHQSAWYYLLCRLYQRH